MFSSVLLWLLLVIQPVQSTWTLL